LSGCYAEENDSGHMLFFLSGKGSKRNINGIIRVENCNILPKAYLFNYSINSAGVTVRDYGVITPENKMEFLSGDIKLLVVGGKEWELEDNKRAVNLLNDDKDVIYLYNFLDGYQFAKHLKGIQNDNIYRIPYVPDPFYKSGNEYLDDFLWNITQK
jgi:serine/threonine-protein kinase